MGKVALKAVRESCGLAIDEVARYCGISASVMKKLEDNPGKMKASMVIRLRKLYGVPIDHVDI